MVLVTRRLPARKGPLSAGIGLQEDDEDGA